MSVGALTKHIGAAHAMLGMETNERHATDPNGRPWCGVEDEMFNVPEDDVTCRECVQASGVLDE